VNLSKSPSSRDLEPDWGRNGAQNGMIAFASDGTGDRDILIMDEDGNGKKNLTSHLTDGGDDWSPVWSADQSGIAFVGTHQAWGNFTPNIYVTWLATPNSLGVVSDHTAGSHSLPAWEGNTSVFYVGQYTPSPAIFRYDVAATQRTRLTSLPGVTGEQYAVNPQFIYIGTNNGIKSVEWHYQNRVADIGSGWNPDLP
jgi:Tol biopolymer transport system component